MKKLVAVLFLLLCSTSLIHSQKTRFSQTADKPNPTDFTIKMHISASHIRHNCSGYGDRVSCREGLYADAIVNGKKIELSGVDVIDKKDEMLIIPGDYSARLTKDIHNADSTAIHQEYDILLTDGIVWHCMTTGIFE